MRQRSLVIVLTFTEVLAPKISLETKTGHEKMDPIATVNHCTGS